MMITNCKLLFFEYKLIDAKLLKIDESEYVLCDDKDSDDVSQLLLI